MLALLPLAETGSCKRPIDLHLGKWIYRTVPVTGPWKHTTIWLHLQVQLMSHQNVLPIWWGRFSPAVIFKVQTWGLVWSSLKIQCVLSACQGRQSWQWSSRLLHLLQKTVFCMRQGNVKVHYNELEYSFLGLTDVSLTSTVQFKDWLIKCLADADLICFFVACTWQLDPFVLVSIRTTLTLNFHLLSVITLLTLYKPKHSTLLLL